MNLLLLLLLLTTIEGYLPLLVDLSEQVQQVSSEKSTLQESSARLQSQLEKEQVSQKALTLYTHKAP